MFDLTTLTTFTAVVLGLSLIPGLTMLPVPSRTIQGGRRTDILTGPGVTSGDFAYTLFATVGLSVLLTTSALVFNVVKAAGATYLIYLGVCVLLGKLSDPSLPSVSSVTPLKAYLQVIPAEVLNPKTALSSPAFMPQFVHPERGLTLAQFAVLGLVFVVLSLFYMTLIARSIRPLGRIVKWLTWLTRWQGKIIGLIFTALGLRVAVQQR